MVTLQPNEEESVMPAEGGTKRKGTRHGLITNPLALLRLSPRTGFEHVITDGYNTDVLGWFGESWDLLKSNARVLFLGSLPSVLAGFAIIMHYYAGHRALTTTADIMFGSYPRTIALMTLALLPSFVALGALSKSKEPARDYKEALWRLPAMALIAAAEWAPIVYSGLMGELRGTVRWWAIPIAMYFGVSFSFAPFLAIDGGLDFWTALDTSRRAVSRNWFGIAGLYVIFYPAAWVFSAALSMLPGIFSTILVVDEMAVKRRLDPINIMFGFSNAFMAALFYTMLIFFNMALATAYVRIFRPVGYSRR